MISEYHKLARSLELNRDRVLLQRWLEELSLVEVDYPLFFDALSSMPITLRWRLAWLLSQLVEKNPEKEKLAQPFLVKYVLSQESEGMERDLWRSLSFMDVNEAYSGALFDKACKTIMNPIKAIAVRAHAMLVAYNIAKNYPELRQELGMVLEPCLEDESAGVKSRAKNVLAKLKPFKS